MSNITIKQLRAIVPRLAKQGGHVVIGNGALMIVRNATFNVPQVTVTYSTDNSPLDDMLATIKMYDGPAFYRALKGHKGSFFVGADGVAFTEDKTIDLPPELTLAQTEKVEAAITLPENATMHTINAWRLKAAVRIAPTNDDRHNINSVALYEGGDLGAAGKHLAMSTRNMGVAESIANMPRDFCNIINEVNGSNDRVKIAVDKSGSIASAIGPWVVRSKSINPRFPNLTYIFGRQRSAPVQMYGSSLTRCVKEMSATMGSFEDQLTSLTTMNGDLLLKMYEDTTIEEGLDEDTAKSMRLTLASAPHHSMDLGFVRAGLLIEALKIAGNGLVNLDSSTDPSKPILIDSDSGVSIALAKTKLNHGTKRAFK